jgi:hypothetical protein
MCTKDHDPRAATHGVVVEGIVSNTNRPRTNPSGLATVESSTGAHAAAATVQLPPFKPWRVAPLLEARLKGIDQHVALVIARHTPLTGRLRTKWHEVAEWSGWGTRSVTRAAKRIIDAGLITCIGFRDGVDIIWTPAAYQAPQVGNSLDNS